MLTLYGPARSRAGRALWMLAECDAPFVHDDLTQYATMGDKSAAMKQVYPLGKIPVLRDGDLLLAESMAINLYLAQHYGRHLWPEDAADQARVLQWSFFAVTEVDPPLVQLMIERSMRREKDKNVDNETRNAEAVKRPLSYLNDCLASRQYLVGERFTVADLNCACVFTFAKGAQLDVAEYPNIAGWLERCQARPAWRKTLGPPPA